MSLEVTFAEVLAAAELGRARIAPEMAGYLALGVADALVGRPVVVDPRTCALDDEGTIFIRPASTPVPSPGAMQLEGAVRDLLGSLLEVSRGGGGGANTLLAVARRTAVSDIGALIGEIEAALIPVNRAAAKRALARLARETAKARDEGHLFLVGSHEAEEPPPERDEDTEPLRIPVQADVTTPTPPVARASPLPAVVEPKEAAPAEPSRTGLPSKPPSSPPPKTRADELLARFSGAVVQSDQEIARELKAMAGLEPTPPPPVAAPTEPTSAPRAADAESPPTESVGAPPPSFDEPLELPLEGRSKAASYLLGGLLVAGIAATVATWIYYPEFFTGR